VSLERTGERVAFRGRGQTFTFEVVSDERDDFFVQVPRSQVQDDLNLPLVVKDADRFDEHELSYLVPLEKWNARVTMDGQYRD